HVDQVQLTGAVTGIAITTPAAGGERPERGHREGCKRSGSHQRPTVQQGRLVSGCLVHGNSFVRVRQRLLTSSVALAAIILEPRGIRVNPMGAIVYQSLHSRGRHPRATDSWAGSSPRARHS